MKLANIVTTKNWKNKRAVTMSMVITGLVVLALFVLKGFFPFGKGSIMLTDMYSQYIPLLYRFYDVVSGSKNLFIEFDILAGANLYGDTINEILNPFNYILFLFGREKIYLAVNIIFFAYVVSMAGSATYAINRLCQKAEHISWILGICYALSGYTAYNFQIIKWMYLPILFPLFFVALIEMLNGQSGRKYAILLAYQLMLSIQLGFMILLFSLFAGGIYAWFELEKEVRRKRLSYMGICTIVGVGISMVVTLPTALILMQSARSSQNWTYFEVMKQHGLDDIFERFYQVAHPVILGMLIPVLKRAKENKTRWLLVLAGFLWVTIILQPANLLWHMGSYVCFPVRYGYMVLFVMCLLVVELYKEVDFDVKIIKTIVGVGAFVVSFAAVMIREDLLTQAFSSLAISLSCPKDALYVMAIIIVLVCAAVVTRNNKSGLFIVACAWGLISLAMICLPETAIIRHMNETVYQNYEYAPTNNFERVCEVNDEHMNTGLITARPSLSGYIPSGNGKYQKAMNELGYTTNWVSVLAEGGIADEQLSNVWLSNSKYADNITKLSKDCYEVDKRTGRVLISAPNDPNYNQILIPLANIPGWTVKGGKITEWLGGFIGVKLDKECFDIELTYHTPGIIAGLICSIVSTFLLVVLGKEWLKERKFLATVYSSLFIVGIVGIYVVPTVGMFIFMTGKALGIVDTREVSEYNFILANETDEGLAVEIAGENILQSHRIKVTADSIEGDGFKAAYAIDGDYKNRDLRWSSKNDWDNNDHYLCVDFKKPTPVQFVRIMWERDNACKYALEYSNNKKEWQIAKAYNSNPESLIQNIRLDDKVSARYFRIHITDVDKNEDDLSLYYQNVSLVELEMYEDLPEEILIKAPSMDSRKIIPEEFCNELPEGFELVYSGCDYENLIDDKGNVANTVADVEVGIGFTLFAGEEKYQLPSLNVIIPQNEKQDFEPVDESRYFKTTMLPVEACLSGEMVPQASVVGNIVDDKTLGEEGYEVKITESQITISANSNAGLSFASTTLISLLEDNDNKLPVGIIRDYPKYDIRGFGIDVGRRAISMELLYRIVDEMASKKMNTFIVHLNDNQIIANEHVSTKEEAYALNSGFRLESDLGISSTDLVYSKKEFAEFIAYAKKLGVNVVPEIDTPSHSLQFTKKYPELALGNDPNSQDELDISKKETVDFAKELWSEYLDTTFAECDTVHLGMDEYYGDGKDLVNYINTMSSLVGNKETIVWGSLSGINADYSRVRRDITMQIWDTSWADPEEMVNAGFSVINSLSCNMYIIPGTAYDNLDMDYLENKWQPYRFDTAETEYVMPSWSPQIKGACYMLWNDFEVSVAGVLSEDDLYDRFEAPIECLANKLW